MVPSVLVTGGAGFVGTALANRLQAIGHEVVVFDALHPQVHADCARPAGLDSAVRLVVGDVTDPDAVGGALSSTRPDVIVHLAAETGTEQSQHESSRHGLVNVVGTTRLLDELRRLDHRPSHLVLASSRAVYGEGQWRAADGTLFAPGPRRPADLRAGRWDPPAPDGAPARPVPHHARVTPPMPSSVYGATKLAQEHVLLAWGASYDVPVSIMRLQNVYGPGQSTTNGYAGVLTQFALTAVAGRVIDVFEDGAIRRDFVHVEDVVTALLAAIADTPAVERLVDIGSGVSVSLLAIAEAIAATTGAPDPVVSGRFRVGDVRAAGCDPDGAAAELAFAPTWKLPHGLEALVASVARTVTTVGATS